MFSPAHRTIVILLGCALFIMGLVIGHYIPSDILGTEPDLRATGPYRYVSPLLECGERDTLTPGEVSRLRGDVEEFIARQKNQGSVTEAAVYFRDLNNGPWFGINEEMMFTPGSLTKVPLMMSLFRKAEQDPGFLDTPVSYTRPSGYAVPSIVSETPLVVGNEYPLGEIVRAMIVYSDNAAAEVAFGTLGTQALNETFTDLGLSPLPIDRDHSITVRHYATFFRVLFNATYLTPELSDRALTILTEAEFKDGLAAGVPASIPVAHKFGEREVGEVAQLHDCGIVYVPGKPYTLCVMTRGSDLDALKEVIEGVSRLSYEAMSS